MRAVIRDTGKFQSAAGQPTSSDIFRIPARKCLRCGGLLTSAQAIRDGYGHTCKIKMHREEAAKEEAKNQYSLFDREEE